MAGASRKANFAAPMRAGYTGLGAARSANRPAGAELGNWSTTYTNSYEVCLLLPISPSLAVNPFVCGIVLTVCNAITSLCACVCGWA